MGEEIVIPPPEEQKEYLLMKLNKSLVAGEKWYLIDIKWMDSLKEFLGIENRGGTGIPRPGPIDNSPLLDESNTNLRPALVDKTHYEFVPEDVWFQLVDWYGVQPGLPTISRKVIESQTNYCIIEVYMIELKTSLNFNFDDLNMTIKISRVELFENVRDRLKTMYKIENKVNTRVWYKIPSDREMHPINLNLTSEQFGNSHNVILILETCSADGIWPMDRMSMEKNSRSYSYNSLPSSSSMSYSSYNQIRHNMHQSKQQPGVCGLNNIGNSCYMNSVLQCMSNSPSITEYFLSMKHLEELNTTNPLGMKGEIAKVYGKLISTMWSGDYATTNPMEFKVQVGKFNPSFNGRQQHDCQELLTFLLDGLHEDLNRIKEKPYIEIKDHGGRDDEVVAKEAWDNYKKRNDSIIVDTFHGLLKSTVVCPDCEKLSVTFDPFCYLSLPLPLKKDRVLSVTLIPFDGHQREQKYRLNVPRKGVIRELCNELADKAAIDPNNLLVAEISRNHFHKFFSNDDSLENVDEKDSIFVFQLPHSPRDSSNIVIPVCCWEICRPNDSFMWNHLFGVPFIITVPKVVTLEELQLNIIKKIQRHFKLPPINGVLPSEMTLSDFSSVEPEIRNSWFNIYVLDNSSYNAFPLEFINGYCDISDSISRSDDSDRHFGRKLLLLQFSAELRQELYREKPPADVNDSIINNAAKEVTKLTIHDCLSLFTTCEKLSADDAWYCPSCKQHKRATKKFDLWKLPKMLVIQLKRFSYCRGRRDKIDNFVEFPITNLQIPQSSSECPSYSYDLIGVCNHIGHMGSGHYTADCKNKDTEKWYCFNDDNVFETSERELVTKKAYLLFYMANTNNTDVGSADSMDLS